MDTRKNARNWTVRLFEMKETRELDIEVRTGPKTGSNLGYW